MLNGEESELIFTYFANIKVSQLFVCWVKNVETNHLVKNSRSWIAANCPMPTSCSTASLTRAASRKSKTIWLVYRNGTLCEAEPSSSSATKSTWSVVELFPPKVRPKVIHKSASWLTSRQMSTNEEIDGILSSHQKRLIPLCPAIRWRALYNLSSFRIDRFRATSLSTVKPKLQSLYIYQVAIQQHQVAFHILQPEAV